MAGQVYFGNGTKQFWIKAPKTGMSANQVGFNQQSNFLNGKSFVKRSSASHKEYNVSWIGYQQDDEQAIYCVKEFADGLYGDGPFYFLDPYAVKTNVMPENWAAPMLIEKDWPTIASGINPTFNSIAVGNGYPVKYARFATTNSYVSTRKLTLIIPTGYKLHFGWHAPSGSPTTGIRILPYKRSDGSADTAINPTAITAGGTIRTNTQVSGTTYSKVEIFIATSTGVNLDICAMIAQILPQNSSVEVGGFISGRGTTALEFKSHPEIEYYSANLGTGLIGLSTGWIEV